MAQGVSDSGDESEGSAGRKGGLWKSETESETENEEEQSVRDEMYKLELPSIFIARSITGLGS